MSFAAKVKKELTQLEPIDSFASAELAALVRMNGSLSFARQQVGWILQLKMQRSQGVYIRC